MTDELNKKNLADQVGRKERRKLKAKETKSSSIWSSLCTFGIIGWTVAVPLIIGILIGIWMDGAYPQGFSWTLTFLFVGGALGCFNAWHWISKESKKIKNDEEAHDE